MGAVASLLSRTRSIPAISKGLESLGYTISLRPQEKPTTKDVLVLWNRLPTHEPHAREYERVGARVLVFEHSWIGLEGVYACCLGHHNGAGTWHIGSERRWPSFGIEVKPWRTEGDHILVVPQRGMGVAPVAMPRGWTSDVLARLAPITKRPIVVRYPQDRIHPFEPELRGAHAVVTWASGAGVKAIINGVPVFYEMPHWIGAYAAINGLTSLELPYLGERDTFFHRLSWAMWRAEEIERGEPFKWLL
jgi:hypothetical protein